jgi:hypothetical protein
MGEPVTMMLMAFALIYESCELYITFAHSYDERVWMPKV